MHSGISILFELVVSDSSPHPTPLSQPELEENLLLGVFLFKVIMLHYISIYL